MDPADFTPTQRRILDVLQDGGMHRPEDLIACLCDGEMGSVSTVRFYMAVIRRKIRPRGQDIVCRRMPEGGGNGYQLVRLLNNS